MAGRPLVAVATDTHVPSAKDTVEVTLVWGGEVVAVGHAPSRPRPGALLRASGLGGAIAASFEELPLARAREDGGWDLLLPDGELAPRGTRLTMRAGKAALRVRLVGHEGDAGASAARGPRDARVRRAFLGAAMLHVAIVLVAIMGAPPPGSDASGSHVDLVAAQRLVVPALGEPAEETTAAAAPLPESPPTSAEAPVLAARDVAVAATVDPPPSEFGMVALARSRGTSRAAEHRAALTFETFDPSPELLAMFVPSIDEGVSAAGLTLR